MQYEHKIWNLSLQIQPDTAYITWQYCEIWEWQQIHIPDKLRVSLQTVHASPPVMWFRCDVIHATRFKPNGTLASLQDTGWGLWPEQIRPYCSWPQICVWKKTKTKKCAWPCVCQLGDGDVRELGAQAGVGPLQARAQCQCDSGGLADPRQPALPDICSLHQTRGPRCRQVCHLDPSECSSLNNA